ncbi:MAG TPA: SRPBCC family protein, partial [Nitrospiraceae bacterium]|nr:SRPBCC family protein [Nitrospiraceae bacterium]
AMDTKARIRDSFAIAAGAGVGASLMYFCDAERGGRRRALLRNKITRAGHLAQEGLATTWRDARNRSRGLMAETSAFLHGDTEVADRVLSERVRSKLGTLVRHPGSITVTADQGHVTLTGAILSYEVDQLLEGVRRVRGVKAISNRLEAHDDPDRIPELQGDPPRAPRGEPFELLQTNWSPAARFVAGAAGAGLLLYGMSRRTAFGAGLGLLGSAALARAAMNLPLNRLCGIAAGRRAVEIHKTVVIAAPLERVFAFWSDYEDWPRYTSRVREVLQKGEGRSRWTVRGPAGAELSWTAIITSCIPNEELAWKTEPGSLVQHAGILRFVGNPDGTTTIHMTVSYNPPGGAILHGIAAMFGQDLTSLLEEELVRIKTVLEEGKIPHDVQQRQATPSPMLKAEQLET